MTLTLELLPGTYAVCRLEPEAGVPPWARGAFVSTTRTPDELSIVCPQVSVPLQIPAERDWRCLRVAGTLELSMTGVLASLTDVLAKANVGVFVVSTFDTDYVLVKASSLAAALEALAGAGHAVRGR